MGKRHGRDGGKIVCLEWRLAGLDYLIDSVSIGGAQIQFWRIRNRDESVIETVHGPAPRQFRSDRSGDNSGQIGRHLVSLGRSFNGHWKIPRTCQSATKPQSKIESTVGVPLICREEIVAVEIGVLQNPALP